MHNCLNRGKSQVVREKALEKVEAKANEAQDKLHQEDGHRRPTRDLIANLCEWFDSSARFRSRSSKGCQRQERPASVDMIEFDAVKKRLGDDTERDARFTSRSGSAWREAHASAASNPGPEIKVYIGHGERELRAAQAHRGTRRST